MFAWFARLAVPVAAVALFAMAPLARGDAVVYYTTGSFSAGPGFNTGTGSAVFVDGPLIPLGPSDFSGTSTVTVDQPTNGQSSTLSYAYSTLEIVSLTNGRGTGSFGSFTVSSSDASGLDNFDGINFTLNIYQYIPTTGQGSLVGSVTGTLDLKTTDLGPFGTVTSPSSNLVLTFTPSTLTIPSTGGVSYSIEPPAGSVVISSTGPTTLTGTVAVPLPAPASAGFCILGGLASVGGLNYLRRYLGAPAAAV